MTKPDRLELIRNKFKHLRRNEGRFIAPEDAPEELEPVAEGGEVPLRDGDVDDTVRSLDAFGEFLQTRRLDCDAILSDELR